MLWVGGIRIHPWRLTPESSSPSLLKSATSCVSALAHRSVPWWECHQMATKAVATDKDHNQWMRSHFRNTAKFQAEHQKPLREVFAKIHDISTATQSKDSKAQPTAWILPTELPSADDDGWVDTTMALESAKVRLKFAAGTEPSRNEVLDTVREHRTEFPNVYSHFVGEGLYPETDREEDITTTGQST